MANVMTNQVNQLYVVKTIKNTAAVAPKSVTVATTGDINLVQRPKAQDEYYLAYKGADTLLRSDILKKGQVTEVRYTSAEKQRTYLKTYKVTLDSAVNGGVPIIGEDYELKIAISQFQDLAEESVYYKYGFVHATAIDTADAAHFYYAMAKSLYKNFAREITKFFEFDVLTDSNAYTIEGSVYDADADELTVKTATGTTTIAISDITGILIKELEQDWNLGLMPKTTVNFMIIPDEVTYNGDFVKWGVVEDTDDTTRYIIDGYTLADMEYFYMGERGDQYRAFARPQDRIPTKLLVDPTVEYCTVNIHYYFVDSLGGVQKSEKDITLVIPNTAKANAKTLAATIATATGAKVVNVE